MAIHPGYGFLSENDHFAALCEANDLVFIGAPAKTMQALSDKSKIKSMMRDVGLPIIPGTETLANVDEAIREAEKIGYPVMLKARSGGGGRGIRMVTSPEELEQVFATAEAESRAAFGDGALYLENVCIRRATWNFRSSPMNMATSSASASAIVLCSCAIRSSSKKRRRPAVTAEMRDALIEDICAAVKAIGYVGLGTLEFLLDKGGPFLVHGNESASAG